MRYASEFGDRILRTSLGGVEMGGEASSKPIFNMTPDIRNKYGIPLGLPALAEWLNCCTFCLFDRAMDSREMPPSSITTSLARDEMDQVARRSGTMTMTMDEDASATTNTAEPKKPRIPAVTNSSRARPGSKYPSLPPKTPPTRVVVCPFCGGRLCVIG